MLQVMLSWAAMGYRVMGVVCGKATVNNKQDFAWLSLANIKDNMRDVRLLGFMVISNPVRSDSGSTIAELQKK
jgi:magnesium-transporting ATPase (P-type)